jgi:hypothetical protein
MMNKFYLYNFSASSSEDAGACTYPSDDITPSFFENGMLAARKKGLGFGCGEESLSSLFVESDKTSMEAAGIFQKNDRYYSG